MLDEDAIVVRADSPVLGVVILVWIVLLVVGEEGVELQALAEVLSGFEASNILEHVEVAVGVNTGLDQSVPVDALKLDVSIVLLVGETHGAGEAEVWSLDRVHVFTSHLELMEVEVFREHLHYFLL